jgi:hypothetical protein
MKKVIPFIFVLSLLISSMYVTKDTAVLTSDSEFIEFIELNDQIITLPEILPLKNEYSFSEDFFITKPHLSVDHIRVHSPPSF